MLLMNPNDVRRMRDDPLALDEGLRTYARTEYNGDGRAVLREIARAGRGMPAPNPRVGGLARLLAAVVVGFLGGGR